MTLLKELREYALNVMPGHPNDVCSRAAGEIERLREAFKENCYCPRPANAAPPGELTVGRCMARGECGCIYAQYFADEQNARVTDVPPQSFIDAKKDRDEGWPEMLKGE